MKVLLSFIVYFFFSIIQIHADSSVWKVESNGQILYLGGTVHILRQEDYPLPAEFDEAYKDSRILVLEVNPNDMSQTEMQEYIRTHGVYTDERSLKTVLSDDVYKQFRQYCRENEISVMGFNKLKPSVITITLLGLKLRNFNAATGVDMHFYEKSKNDNKSVKGLETHAEQLDILVSMGEGHESEFLSQSLKEFADLDKNLGDMITAWRSGDLQKIYEMQIKEMESLAPGLYQSLLLDRNNRWLPKIEEYLKSPEKELILVGCAHLAGPSGLIEVLRKKGYLVTPVKVEEKSK